MINHALYFIENLIKSKFEIVVREDPTTFKIN